MSASLFLSNTVASNVCASSRNSSCAVGSVRSTPWTSVPCSIQIAHFGSVALINVVVGTGRRTSLGELDHPDRNHLVPVFHKLGHEPVERVLARLVGRDGDGKNAGISRTLIALTLRLSKVSRRPSSPTGTPEAKAIRDEGPWGHSRRKYKRTVPPAPLQMPQTRPSSDIVPHPHHCYSSLFSETRWTSLIGRRDRVWVYRTGIGVGRRDGRKRIEME